MVVCPVCWTLRFARRDSTENSVEFMWRCDCGRLQAEFEAPNRTMKVEEGTYWMCVKTIVRTIPDPGRYVKFVRGTLWEREKGGSIDLVPGAAVEERIGEFADLMRASAVLDS